MGADVHVEVRTCGWCPTVLSRYNREAVCASCTRADRQAVFAAKPAPARPPVAASCRPCPGASPLGRLLVEYRQRHGLTQAAIARLLGVDQSYVSCIETGRKRVRDVELLAHIAACLALPLEAVGLAASVSASTADWVDGEVG